MENPPIRVAVVVFDGITPFHLSVPCMVFEGRAFDVRVCAVDTGTVRTSAGFTVNIRHGLAQLAQADIVVLPSWKSSLEVPPPALLNQVRRAHARGARIVGLCLGAFVVAEAGLLDQRTATTHWAAANDFAQRFPEVALDQNVLYVDHGDVITSAGTAAGIDCCLHIVREQFGADAAAHIARRMVVAPHRRGGQAQFIDQPLPVAAGDARLARVMESMLQHLGQSHSLDQLAGQAVMSRRTFTRTFQKLTGSTVGQWLLTQRLALAQRQLESTRRSIDDIAIDCGFGSALMLRRHFARAFGISPSAYRHEFQG